MADRYRFDPGQSRFTVQAFAAGFLSFLGHSPTFVVRDFAGEASFADGTIASMQLEVVVKADVLELVDKVSAADRQEIEGRMRREVLETALYPEIVFRSSKVSAERTSPGRHRLRIDGQMSLHGVARPIQTDAALVVFEDGIRLQGEVGLHMSQYRIKPVIALGGSIKLKDELKVSFDMAGIPQAAEQQGEVH